MNNLKVSAIVPVYNEEKTIGKVVKTLIKSSLINEVIVVNDGSSDKSLEIIKKFEGDVAIINLKNNKGKGNALVKGVRKAKNKVVAFIDADLVNLNQDYLTKLIEPVTKYHWRGVIGVRKKGKMLPAPFAKLSGERVYFKKDLMPILKKMEKSRFGIEVLLNHAFAKWPIKKLVLMKLKGLYKYEKYSLTEATREYLNEGVEIAMTLVNYEKLLPSDLDIVEKLKDTVDLSDLKSRVSKIKNKQLKFYLNDYIIKYLKQARDWLNKS